MLAGIAASHFATAAMSLPDRADVIELCRIERVPSDMGAVMAGAAKRFGGQ